MQCEITYFITPMYILFKRAIECNFYYIQMIIIIKSNTHTYISDKQHSIYIEINNIFSWHECIPSWYLNKLKICTKFMWRQDFQEHSSWGFNHYSLSAIIDNMYIIFNIYIGSSSVAYSVYNLFLMNAISELKKKPILIN